MTVLTTILACTNDEEPEPTSTTEILYTMPEETEKKLTVLKGFLATRNLDTLPTGTKITIFELDY